MHRALRETPSSRPAVRDRQPRPVPIEREHRVRPRRGRRRPVLERPNIGFASARVTPAGPDVPAMGSRPGTAGTGSNSSPKDANQVHRQHGRGMRGEGAQPDLPKASCGCAAGQDDAASERVAREHRLEQTRGQLSGTRETIRSPNPTREWDSESRRHQVDTIRIKF